jgi:hypothetical protein
MNHFGKGLREPQIDDAEEEDCRAQVFWGSKNCSWCVRLCSRFPSQDDLAQLYSAAQKAQAAGDLATAGQKYEAIVRLRPTQSVRDSGPVR